jgi:endonuclease/exonuclease/phosphatase family metal-dependent hydrolase
MKRTIIFFTLLLLLFFCIWLGKRETVPPKYLTIMTYNIHHGKGVDGVLDLDRIADLIQKSGADLVALQEVDVKTERVQGLHTMQYLAEKLDMEWVFGQNLSFQGGGYGNGILSAYPIESWTNEHFPLYLEGEQRGLLQTMIHCQGMTIAFWNTHLDHRPNDTERKQSATTIVKKSDTLRYSLVIAGDFNDIPESSSIQKINQSFLDTWHETGHDSGFTFPTQAPERRIDYIFYRDHSDSYFHLKPVKSTILQSPASDHLPLVVVFEILTYPQKIPS